MKFRSQKRFKRGWTTGGTNHKLSGTGACRGRKTCSGKAERTRGRVCSWESREGQAGCWREEGIELEGSCGGGSTGSWLDDTYTRGRATARQEEACRVTVAQAAVAWAEAGWTEWDGPRGASVFGTSNGATYGSSSRVGGSRGSGKICGGTLVEEWRAVA